MTNSQTPAPATTTISTADDLASLWAGLMGDGGFGRRTLWLAVLDDSGRPAEVLLPIDDVPPAPGVAELKGLPGAVQALSEYGTVVTLLSRPGPVGVQESDRRWARALTPLAPRFPVHLATADSSGRPRIQPIE